VAEVAPEPVGLPDDEGVPFPKRLEAGGEAGPVVAPAGGEVFVGVLRSDPGGDERVPLQVRDLRPVRFRPRIVPDQQQTLLYELDYGSSAISFRITLGSGHSTNDVFSAPQISPSRYFVTARTLEALWSNISGFEGETTIFVN
jgi:hypothetical protein